MSKLGAWFMTHFCPREPALPLSPLLVVKFDHILTLDFDINFSHFLINFWSIGINFSEKVDFAIKNRVFWHIFDIIFEWILVIFVSFFDPFLGFLGGYPSPSISAPLVVKKCLKLYIYNIGLTHPPMISLSLPWGPISVKPIKCTKCINVKNEVSGFIEGRTRMFYIYNSTLWISPTRNYNFTNRTRKNNRGENESI